MGSLDAQVRKGEKASLVIFYKQFDVEPNPEDEGDDGSRRVAKASWDVARVDGYTAPVVRRAADGERELVTMRWGFMLLQNGKAPRPVTNVRDDKILTSGFWRGSFDERRCLVPASSFCEPNGDVKPATWATNHGRCSPSPASGDATRGRSARMATTSTSTSTPF